MAPHGAPGAQKVFTDIQLEAKSEKRVTQPQSVIRTLKAPLAEGTDKVQRFYKATGGSRAEFSDNDPKSQFGRTDKKASAPPVVFQRSQIFFIVLCLLFNHSHAGRILMYLPVATRSHLSAWTPLAGALAEHGHQVTFVTGYQEPHLPETVDQLVVDNSMFRVFQDHFVANTMRAEGTLWSLLSSISEGWEAIQTTQKNALSHPRFQEFLHNPNCTWDLVIASPFINEAGVMLADHFKAPMILYLPANAGEFLSLSLGHPDSVAWSGAMAGSLGGRINTLLGHMAYELLIKPKYFVQPQYAELREHIPNYTMASSYSDLERNADFAFYFSSPHLGSVAPRLPNTANTAFIQTRPGRRLNEDLQSWLNKSNASVVYVSMGSIIRSEHLPEKHLETFEKVFAKLKLRVIWKRSGQSTENTFMANWVDQQDVLAHPKVKLFISQVGLMSLQEAIWHEVPILGVPLLYEQKLNSELIRKNNLGGVVDFNNFNQETLTEAMLKLEKDRAGIQASISSLARRVRDSRTTPLQDAVWWCEYVMRHKGGNELQSDYRHLSLVKFYSLDILLLLMVQATILLVVFYISLRYVLHHLPFHRALPLMGSTANKRTRGE